MEEEISYSSLVFKNKALTEQEPKDELSIYSEVKKQDAVTAGPKEKDDLETQPAGKPEEPVATAPKVQAAVKSRITLVCLGTIFLLLVVVVLVVLLVNITMVMKKQEATISDLAAKNMHLILENRNLTNQTEQILVENKVLENRTERLLVEKRSLCEQTKQLMENTRILENQTAELRKERDNLNWTLEVILTFENFPVKNFCPQRKCKPCQDGWIMLNESCYLFYYESSPWKTWNESRQYCRTKGADLVVIDSLEEQKFVSNRSSYYYDVWHGYWLGLREVNNIWTWVDGRIDSLKYWINGSYASSDPSALLIPQKNYSENWAKANNTFLNRFICEHDVLIRSD